jgi:hypothetical protein
MPRERDDEMTTSSEEITTGDVDMGDEEEVGADMGDDDDLDET